MAEIEAETDKTDWAQAAVDHLNADLGLGIKIRNKADVWHQRLLGKILWPLTRGGYMERYWTTIGRTMYRPSGPGGWPTVFHEAVHVIQGNESRLHSVKYLLPQLLAVPAVGIMLVLGLSWWALLGLVFLLPQPALWRMRAEREAYEVSAAVLEMHGASFGVSNVPSFARQFTGPSYYWMWPFGGERIARDLRLSALVVNVVYSTESFSPILRSAVSFMHANGFLRQSLADRWGMDRN